MKPWAWTDARRAVQPSPPGRHMMAAPEDPVQSNAGETLWCDNREHFQKITLQFVHKRSQQCFNLTNLFEVRPFFLPASLRLFLHCSVQVYVETCFFSIVSIKRGMNRFPSNCFNVPKKLPVP